MKTLFACYFLQNSFFKLHRTGRDTRNCLNSILFYLNFILINIQGLYIQGFVYSRFVHSSVAYWSEGSACSSTSRMSRFVWDGFQDWGCSWKHDCSSTSRMPRQGNSSPFTVSQDYKCEWDLPGPEQEGLHPSGRRSFSSNHPSGT